MAKAVDNPILSLSGRDAAPAGVVTNQVSTDELRKAAIPALQRLVSNAHERPCFTVATISRQLSVSLGEWTPETQLLLAGLRQALRDAGPNSDRFQPALHVLLTDAKNEPSGPAGQILSRLRFPEGALSPTLQNSPLPSSPQASLQFPQHAQS